MLDCHTYKEGKPLHGKKVYIPDREHFKGLYVGMPHVVIVDENGARRSTTEELFEYMDMGGLREGSDLEDKFR